MNFQANGQAKTASKKKTMDAEILTVASRYPHRLQFLQEMGADLILESPNAKAYWDKLLQYSEEEILAF